MHRNDEHQWHLSLRDPRYLEKQREHTIRQAELAQANAVHSIRSQRAALAANARRRIRVINLLALLAALVSLHALAGSYLP